MNKSVPNKADLDPVSNHSRVVWKVRSKSGSHCNCQINVQNVIVRLAMTERCQTRFTEKFDHQNNIVYVGIIIGSLAVLYFYRWCKYEAYKRSFSLCDICANPVLVCADFTSQRSRLAMFWDVWLVTTGWNRVFFINMWNNWSAISLRILE